MPRDRKMKTQRIQTFSLILSMAYTTGILTPQATCANFDGHCVFFHVRLTAKPNSYILLLCLKSTLSCAKREHRISRCSSHLWSSVRQDLDIWSSVNICRVSSDENLGLSILCHKTVVSWVQCEYPGNLLGSTEWQLWKIQIREAWDLQEQSVHTWGPLSGSQIKVQERKKARVPLKMSYHCSCSFGAGQ